MSFLKWKSFFYYENDNIYKVIFLFFKIKHNKKFLQKIQINIIYLQKIQIKIKSYPSVEE